MDFGLFYNFEIRELIWVIRRKPESMDHVMISQSKIRKKLIEDSVSCQDKSTTGSLHLKQCHAIFWRH